MKNLVRKARKGDAEAFAEIIRLNMQDLYKAGKAILKCEEDIADAVQETILSCWKNIGSLQKDKYFKTWLIRIMINKCNDIIKSQEKYVLRDEMPAEFEEEKNFKNIEWEETLNSIDEKYRLIIILYYIHGFKTAEISELLDIKEATVRTRLKRARENLKKEYRTKDKFKIASFYNM